MVNIITGNTDSGNDIRQSLNNINHSGDYNDSLFSSFLNGLDASGKDSQSNLMNEGEHGAVENANGLQLDIAGLLARELHPFLQFNISDTAAAKTNTETTEKSAGQTTQLIVDLISSKPDLKKAAESYISVNQPLPEELKSLLENTRGSEDYGILKEALAIAKGKQDNSGLTDIIPSKSNASSNQIIKLEGNAPKLQLNINDTSIDEDNGNYYKFEPKLRQINSNFSTANINVVTSGAASDIPEDNNMAFISGFIAGRQSYNKPTDKTAQAITDSRQANPLVGTDGPGIPVIDETEEIIDYANPRGIEKLKDALNGNTKQAASNLKNPEIINAKGNDNNVIVSSDILTEKAEETILPKAAAIKAMAVDLHDKIPDKQDQKQTAATERPKGTAADYSAAYQDFGNNSGDSTGQKQSLQNEIPAFRDSAKSNDIKPPENDFAGLVRQQKTDTLKNRAKPLESKPGTSQELQRIRLSEFPAATVKLVKNSAGNAVSTARLSLRPESLGALEIKITMAGDTASLSIKADSREAVRSLEGQIGTLREKLSQNGIDTDKIEVSYNEDGRLGTNLSKDSYGGYAQREYTETMRDFLGSFGETGEEESAGTINIDNGTNSGNNRVYIGQDSSFVQYV